MTKNNHLASIEEIINDAKNGKMFILVDDENRENEGDLVIPAQMCDDQKINFMAKFGRGLICLALEESRVNQLELPLMALNNESRHRTAFTVSIEAKEGIATGISAQDRAKTIEVAISATNGKESIVSPGHIFPLKAQNGGVLVRAGHTEASVDIAKLAGLNPSGVICEIMNDDGTMARLPDLIKFAKKHNLKIATIADLIEYRRKKEKLIEIVKSQKFLSRIAGLVELKIYRSKIDGIEHLALIKGKIDSSQTILVRMHHLNIIADCLEEAQNPRSGLLNKSLKKINKAQNGVIVIIRQPHEKIEDLFFNNQNPHQNFRNDSQKTLRNYGTGAQILADLGIKNLILLSNSKKSVIGLDAFGIKICGYKKI
ncbi:MAG: 3,4-dihydroxy-2-butanone-4-phosphate synthase [Alphaproteobacteria bacterium]|nr:3,4-dihydroxy-2-butanone-4-phosphate synthase [Alphaproteobacteria bacterium]